MKISHTPILLDCDSIVFTTESRLYSSDAFLNHRLARNYLPVREMLYEKVPDNRSLNMLIAETAQ